jgi:predicted RNA binding protein YcfA (HicA-like mRNA interferase family)
LGKLRILSGKQVCDILSRNGFVEIRQRGSHIVMQKQLPNTTITVPVPNHSELRTAEHYNPSFDNPASQRANLNHKHPRGT